MKAIQLFVVLFTSFIVLNASAQTQEVKKDSVTVFGNCGMCKNRIQKAALNAGATTASWDEDSRKLTVTFAADKTSMEAIEKAVAAVGHDTKNATAADEVYSKLPGCCKYERKPAKKN